MTKADIYTLKGTKVGELTLPKEVFEQKINLKLLAQANHVYQERSHVGLRSTKTRSEVNRTTKKLYKQKGTGGARHGSRRANLFVGGGVVFGPRPLRRILDMPQGIKKAAMIAAFSAKAKAGEIIAVRSVTDLGKTKEAADFLSKIKEERKGRRFTFMLSENSHKAYKFLRNLENVTIVFYNSVNAFDILGAGTVVLDESIFEAKKEKVVVKKVETKVKAVKKSIKK